MNVLVIAPHPDDETIGCGGTLCLHKQRGDRVAVVFLTSGELGLKQLPREKAWAVREKEARAAAKILGLAKVEFLRQPDWMLGDHLNAAAHALRPVLLAEQPLLISVPHEDEWHPDHQAALPMLRPALRNWRGTSPEVRAYEIWTPLTAHDHVEDISRVMPRKLKALRAHRSQLAEFNYERAVRGLNAFRGELAAKCRYAEVFQTVAVESSK
jgi:N-acetylglucosamine malate deacetylase 1